MLNIYQEFVRNHQYSLQILAHCKQNRDFDKLLKHYEAKPDCEERTLETFLTYPMFQVASGPAWVGESQGGRHGGGTMAGRGAQCLTCPSSGLPEGVGEVVRASSTQCWVQGKLTVSLSTPPFSPGS